MDAVNQKPVTVLREIDGFILNRLQGALLREAFRLVEQGYVSVQDLDTTVSNGLGLRWSFMGPFETIDLNAPQASATMPSAMGRCIRNWPKPRSIPDPGQAS
ncbi:3-hydroxyacyl-CoA dehydrogenase family protein [Advenella kashmirensis]|uniref:3-hydroxyacyl-CoA dehydrogenase family protein n=1 Tax=Advenella kashmirensis TaxID=310575 RepID=UPI002ADE57A0|nr:3-hydroxyacyl-CoA dehydrogenase family protein [Advenella kashmirensis]